MKAIHLSKDGFLKRVHNYEVNGMDWKFEGDKPAVIDFYAPWCGPCKAMSPIMDELAGEYDGKVDIYKVNVEDEQELASLFGVRSIPTLVFIPKEGTPRVSVGGRSKDSLKGIIDELN